ncbi:spore photoproduct lyase family protein [Roseomonas sp. NAR14]|uniref:Spore photoproduct lyase family protein n=1 Tax=Roseomonas acroporae TaxID=2937791 RepID=A0A9X1YFL5_9PROT|nr:spore photoproduct lyase family protein [Roseomonas acroporae]MCK8787973.1 spore photoproduct lyase family protein [Roseomonas acroporae]
MALAIGSPPLPATLLDIGRIYLEPAAALHPRGAEVLARFPHAERIEVPSHWNIPGLHGEEGDAERWLATKRGTLVLGIKKGLGMRPNGRSADFIAPSTSNGCAMACAYCYVARRKGHGNPITLFVNTDAVATAIARHAARQGPKPGPNQVDPRDWVYDIGENGDLSVDAALYGGVRDLVEAFRAMPNAKGSFATKYVNRALLGYEPQGRTRIRFSLMPEAPSRVLDVRASPVAERIAAIDDFVRAGYEVHVNFSPVVVYEGWTADWSALLERLDASLSPAARAQIAAEVIFLTHGAALHETNLRWHPRAEDLLWQPALQEEKLSESGAVNLRYRHGKKGRMLAVFRDLVARHLPCCRIRYAF